MPGTRICRFQPSNDCSVYFPARFYRGAAICSLASAITTLGLIFLPRLYQPVPDFDAHMRLTENPAHVLRSWIYLLHPSLVVIAALAVAARPLAQTARGAG